MKLHRYFLLNNDDNNFRLITKFYKIYRRDDNYMAGDMVVSGVVTQAALFKKVTG